MANKFTRNITGTNLGGNKLNQNDKAIEPFATNVQNDLLSDGTDVYVRQAKNENPESEDKYFCLTDGIKGVKSTSGNNIGVIVDNKNEIRIDPKLVTKEQAESGSNNHGIMTPQRTKQAIEHQVPSLVKEHETPTEIVSNSDELTVTKTSKNNFELEVEIPEPDIDIISEKGNLTVTREGNVFTVDMKSIIPSQGTSTISLIQQDFWGFEKLSNGGVSNIGTSGNQRTANLLTIDSMQDVMTVLFNKITALENEIDALKDDGEVQ